MSSFYKKVTHTLIPESIHNLATTHGNGHDKSDKESEKTHSTSTTTTTNNDSDPAPSAKERSTYQSMSGRLDFEDNDTDDDDVAKLDEGSNFFTGLLDNTTLSSGLGSLNNLKKQYLDDFI